MVRRYPFLDELVKRLGFDNNFLRFGLGGHERMIISVGNLALKGLVGKMVKAGLSPKTVNTYSQVVKSVVASAVNEEGD
jgi:hypothetical protein